MEVRHITETINADSKKVYKFMADPKNLPKWAAGLSRSEMVQTSDGWIADSPMGKVKVAFAPENDFGIVDHDVTLPSGEVNHNPLRVLANGRGSEVVFTLFHRPGVSAQDFEADAKRVREDLKTLKNILSKN